LCCSRPQADRFSNILGRVIERRAPTSASRQLGTVREKRTVIQLAQRLSDTPLCLIRVKQIVKAIQKEARRCKQRTGLFVTQVSRFWRQCQGQQRSCWRLLTERYDVVRRPREPLAHHPQQTAQRRSGENHALRWREGSKKLWHMDSIPRKRENPATLISAPGVLN
jgi:hypothetical protein